MLMLCDYTWATQALKIPNELGTRRTTHNSDADSQMRFLHPVSKQAAYAREENRLDTGRFQLHSVGEIPFN
jgi:hypothetical protein